MAAGSTASLLVPVSPTAAAAISGFHTGQAELALWAARQGLAANPLDETLAIDAITAAAATGRPGAARTEATGIRRLLTARGVTPGAELAQTLDTHT
jgi:hypothetical protein